MTDLKALTGGHERSLWLLGRMQAAMGQPDPAGRRAFRLAYDELATLVSHAQAEEEDLMITLGPAVRRDVWLAIRDEHDEISEFLATIGRALDRNLDPLRGWAMIGLSALMRRHLRREEADLFSLADKASSAT